MKRTLVASSVFAMTVMCTTTANATMIDFDWTGTGSGVINNIASFDWLPSSSYTLGAIGSELNDGDRLNTYVHGSLGSFIDDNGSSITNDFGLNVDYEVTFVAGFREEVFGISDFINPVTGEFVQQLNFASVDNPFNFFELYVDDNVNSNPLTGGGFNDGTLISSGTILEGGGGNISSSFIYSGDPTDPISNDPNDYVDLDQFGVDNWSGVKTNEGIGGSMFNTSADYVNTSFMTPHVNGVEWDGDEFNINFNSSQTVAFSGTNPSAFYDDGNGSMIPAQLGTINGVNGDGVVLQVDGNSSFSANPKELSTPNVLWLLGIGMLAGVWTSKKTFIAKS